MRWPVKSKEGRLRQALAALEADDPATALGFALAAWQAVPDADLAAAIERLGERAARAVHAPGGVTPEDRDAAWHAAAAAGDAVMRHRLIATVLDVGEDREKIARLEALVGARDPRVATALVAMLASRHVSLRFDIPTIWRPLCKMLVACGDPRVRGMIAALDWKPRLARLSQGERAAADVRIAKLTAQLAAAYPDAPPVLAPSEQALAEAIGALAGAPPPTAARDAELEADLLAAIYATPDDDGPRAIYADWLQERGDPRGELIALQLARDPRARRYEQTAESVRIEELLEQHQTRWLGALAGVVRRVEFERGFLASCTVDRRGDAALPDDPAWATVRAIRGAMPATDAHPMPILAEAIDLDRDAMLALARLAAPPPLVALGWRSATDDWTPSGGYRPSTASAIDAFAATIARLPRLRRLDVIGSNPWVTGQMRPDQLGWRWRGTAIRELRITAHIDQLAAWVGQFIASELEVFALVSPLHPHGLRIELDRDPGARHGSMAIDFGFTYDTFDADLPALATAIDRLPADWLAALELKVGSKAVWTLPHRRRMAAALDRHPSLRAPEIYGYTRPKR